MASNERDFNEKDEYADMPELIDSSDSGDNGAEPQTIQVDWDAFAAALRNAQPGAAIVQSLPVEPAHQPVQSTQSVLQSVTVTVDQGTPKVEPKKGKEKEQKRCDHPDCGRRLKITDFPCKCKLNFCIQHRHAYTRQSDALQARGGHFCSHDYKVEEREQLRAQNDPKRDYRSFGFSGNSSGNMTC